MVSCPICRSKCQQSRNFTVFAYALICEHKAPLLKLIVAIRMPSLVRVHSNHPLQHSHIRACTPSSRNRSLACCIWNHVACASNTRLSLPAFMTGFYIGLLLACHSSGLAETIHTHVAVLCIVKQELAAALHGDPLPPLRFVQHTQKCGAR